MMKHSGRIQFQRGTRAVKKPKWGFAGFVGLLGFLGILTYRISQTAFPFFFFSFFGFFGVFFSAKTACDCKDERYVMNELLAERNAYRIGHKLSFIVMLLCCYDWLLPTNTAKFLFLVVSLSLINGAVTFLREYLLYRYDCGAEED